MVSPNEVAILKMVPAFEVVILQIVCMSVNKEREEWLWQPRQRTADALEIRNVSVTALHSVLRFPKLIYFCITFSWSKPVGANFLADRLFFYL